MINKPSISFHVYHDGKCNYVREILRSKGAFRVDHVSTNKNLIDHLTNDLVR